MFTLDQVRSFIAVAEELHFGRAAERLQMTQPPLSRQIQKLEKAVGARLLDRDNRSVELTVAGSAFLDEAYRLLNLVDGAGDLARRVDRGTAGIVRLGFTAVSAISILGPLLRHLTATLPDVDVLLHERVTRAQVDGIRRGELDIGLARPPFDTDVLSSRVVLREPLLAVVPASHPLVDVDRALTPQDFEGELVISYDERQAQLLPRAGRALPDQRPSADRAAGAPGAHGHPAGRRRTGGHPGTRVRAPLSASREWSSSSSCRVAATATWTSTRRGRSSCTSSGAVRSVPAQ